MIANVILLIVGALIAIAAAAAAQFVQHWIQVGHRRCRLAAALAGEVDAIMTIAKHRRLREALKDLRNRIDQEQEPHAFTLHVAQDYFQVYKNNTADIGLLPVHEAGCVARFYIGVFSWVQDVIRPDPEVTVEAAKARIDEQLKLLDYYSGVISLYTHATDLPASYPFENRACSKE